MKKDNKFSIVFLPEFLIPSLEELNITMSDFNDAIKNRRATMDMNVNTDEEYKNTVDKLNNFIGKGDLTELSLLNRYLHDILNIEFYQNNFIMFFEEILQGSGSYKNEENSICLILNTLISKRDVSKDFKDTFSVVNNNNVITIVLKEGFTNYIVGSKISQVRYTLLKEIIDSVTNRLVEIKQDGTYLDKQISYEEYIEKYGLDEA